ncbi:MAG: TA system VapC family ribonuclease toxin [Phycisphaeraceae bacterium]
MVVDTNILLYATNPDSPHHQVCRDRLAQLRAGSRAWYVTWGNLYEYLRVATHPAITAHPAATAEAWAYLRELVGSARMLTETDRHADLFQQLLRKHSWISANLVFDARTVVLMKENGVRRICTFDRDFRRFDGIEVVAP